MNWKGLTMYKLKLSRAELDSLAWVGDRYESAGILYDGLILADCESNSDYDLNTDKHKEYLWQIPEHIAWEYQESIPSDWSYSNPNDCPMNYPPCIGGTLRDKLIELYERIV